MHGSEGGGPSGLPTPIQEALSRLRGSNSTLILGVTDADDRLTGERGRSAKAPTTNIWGCAVQGDARLHRVDATNSSNSSPRSSVRVRSAIASPKARL
jgi:hypothetical protein